MRPKARKKLTKAEQTRIDAEREQWWAAYEKWRGQVHGRQFQAKVTAWDFNRGEGLVYIPDLNATFEIFACNLPGRRTWYPETACVFYMRGDVVQVRFDVHPGITFVVGVTQGYPDNEKWESLDQDRLAFRCDPESGQVESGWLPGDLI